MKDDLLTFVQAGEVIGISRAGVWAAAHRGLLATEQYGPHRLIRKSEALRYAKEKHKRGRPRLNR